MKDDELVKALRNAQEKYKNDIVSVGRIRIDEMARDCADHIEQLAKENVSQQCKILMLTSEVEELRQVASENSELKEAQRWVPVGERLPENDDWVLARVLYSDVPDDFSTLFAWHSYSGRWHVNTGKEDTVNMPVTHWQPLPAAPEKGE